VLRRRLVVLYRWLRLISITGTLLRTVIRRNEGFKIEDLRFILI